MAQFLDFAEAKQAEAEFVHLNDQALYVGIRLGFLDALQLVAEVLGGHPEKPLADRRLIQIAVQADVSDHRFLFLLLGGLFLAVVLALFLGVALRRVLLFLLRGLGCFLAGLRVILGKRWGDKGRPRKEGERR